MVAMTYQIVELKPEDSSTVFDWVVRLLKELGEGDELGALAEKEVLQAWKKSLDRFHVFVAKNDTGEILGILTLAESFAIYANGNYGIINEMYVSPQYRSLGIGAMLVDASKEFGRQRGWARIDVTAPESERWERTRRFYEKEGFAFTGPKLKFLLK
jgi:GNAT superfamily N-acetyltransferase